MDESKALTDQAVDVRFFSLLIPMEIKYSIRLFFLWFAQIAVLSLKIS